jgi:uncharacterized protein involved in oxidation of intracellular sulfur
VAEHKEKIVYINTNGAENPDKAALPFMLAGAALAMEVDAAVVLQSTGVFLAKKGYLDNIPAAGSKSLRQLVDIFREAGGRLLVCIPCLKERNIPDTDLIEGVVLTSGAALNEEILGADATLVY